MIEDMLLPLVSERFRTDERYRTGHIRIINPLPGRRILGVHTPQMKSLAKELAGREDAREIVGGFAGQAASGGRDALSNEEMIVWGMMINCIKCSLEERLGMVEQFVPCIDNWAVCDMFCAGAKWMRKKGVREAVWELLCRYYASDREFEVRFAVVMSMSYYLDADWYHRVLFRIDDIDFGRIVSDYVEACRGCRAEVPQGKGSAPGTPPYYVRMAVAWLLATALYKLPDDTRAYLRHSRLPQDVLKLYVRKARESFRTRDISPF